jgi:uncharacterized membrane protein YfcA
MNLLALLLAILIGVSLGMLGGGGSTLAVPVLVYVARLPVKPAIATSLLVVGGAAAIGALRHLRAGNVDGRAAATFAVVSMAGSYAGARAAAYVPDALQLILFAIIMLVVSVSMMRAKPAAAGDSRRHRSVIEIALVAAFVGILTGLIGVGGGFLIVPALVLVAGLEMKRAIGTSLVVIFANSLTGFLGYAGQVQIDWAVAGAFVAMAIAGVFLGTALTRYASERALRKGFAAFLLAVALFILVENAADIAAAVGSAAARYSTGAPAPAPFRPSAVSLAAGMTLLARSGRAPL